MENGYITTKELIASQVPFSVVYAISDSLAIGACKALLEAGLRIPEDVSVAGFDGLELSKYYNPSITTIAQTVQEMAYTTLRLLFDIIAQKKSPAHIVFEATLLERESTKEL